MLKQHDRQAAAQLIESGTISHRPDASIRSENALEPRPAPWIARRAVAPGASHGEVRRQARFLNWTLDCAANALRSDDGAEHILGVAEVQVLRAFLERPHQILTREQLVGHRNLSPMDRSIDVRISRLRRKIESDPMDPRIIKTVYGAGYVFAAAVEWS